LSNSNISVWKYAKGSALSDYKWKEVCEVCEEVGSLGSNDVVLASLVELLSRFIDLMYGSKSEKIKDIRWDCFCRGATAELLPPTRDAFVNHVKRAHYCANVWKTADNASPPLWDPTKYG
jgi:hypothetical protein